MTAPHNQLAQVREDIAQWQFKMAARLYYRSHLEIIQFKLGGGQAYVRSSVWTAVVP
jgi:hypothetical protein